MELQEVDIESPSEAKLLDVRLGRRGADHRCLRQLLAPAAVGLQCGCWLAQAPAPFNLPPWLPLPALPPPPQISKQPLLPPLLSVVQQGRVSNGHSRSSSQVGAHSRSGSRSQAELAKIAAHSRSGSRTQAELAKATSQSTASLAAAAAAAALDEAQQSAAATGIRQPRPRSIAVLAGPPPELAAYDPQRCAQAGAGWNPCLVLQFAAHGSGRALLLRTCLQALLSRAHMRMHPAPAAGRTAPRRGRGGLPRRPGSRRSG